MLDSELVLNLVHATYLTFAHNYVLLSYLFGLAISAIVAIRKPSRFSLLLFLGFLILSFSFTYDKHIASGLREQTLKALIKDVPHGRAERLIVTFISEILPVFLYVSGWLLIYLAILLKGWKEKSD